MNYIEGLDELVFNLNDMSIEDVDKLSKVLLLVAHFDILIDALQHWEKIGLVDAAANVIKNVSTLLEIVVAKWS